MDFPPHIVIALEYAIIQKGHFGIIMMSKLLIKGTCDLVLNRVCEVHLLQDLFIISENKTKITF